LDAVLVINYLNTGAEAGEGESESASASSFADQVDAAFAEEMSSAPVATDVRDDSELYYFWRLLEDALEELTESSPEKRPFH
jgi:hypothetical protein